MLIVTPAPGTWPEPRPLSLLTGDRAISVLDAPSATALTAAGVKTASVSKDTYNELVDNLVPEVFDGLDPLTGLLKDSVMPERLSEAAINELDLTGIDGRIESQFLPDYLTVTGLATLIGAQSVAIIDTDPDGTPVVEGGAGTTTSVTYSGTVTAGTVTAGTAHGDLITGTQATVTAIETQQITYDLLSTPPGAPAGTGLKLYSDTSKRLVYLDSSNISRRASTIRTVTTLPVAGESVLGDECIIAATGEHRVYKGVTLGWRLASPFSVATLADRDALTNLYPGMMVYCSFGVPQNHVYKGDGHWHGTQGWPITAGIIFNQFTGVNDTNWRTRHQLDITDPGFIYTVSHQVGFEVVALGVLFRSLSNANYASFQGTNWAAYAASYQDTAGGFISGAHRYDYGGITPVLTGSASVNIQWQVQQSSIGAYSLDYQSYMSYRIDPA